MRGILISLFLVSIFSSCTTRPVTPSRDSRRTIDTMYQQKIIVLKPHMDSICTHVYDSLYTLAIDSILSVRRNEMNELVQ